ncbi:hypothetical protein ADL01_41010 [Streptomyces sp. NRRL WC-3618]|nr:hypothetical protein ADL01_41010 [Streptomyces sp. NRRL WC-3618]
MGSVVSRGLERRNSVERSPQGSLDLESRYCAAPTDLGTRLPVMEIEVCSSDQHFVIFRT